MALFYSGNFCPDGPNYTHFKNADFDRLYESALSVNDQGKRVEYYREMDSIIAEIVPVVPLYYGQAIKFLQKDVKGLPSNAINILDLRRVRKVDE
jgi:peptide/nickel transport system substrate-binding protein